MISDHAGANTAALGSHYSAVQLKGHKQERKVPPLPHAHYAPAVYAL